MLLGASTTVVRSLIVVGVISLPFVLALVAQPITRRLAFRYPVRRLGETALIIAGSMLGTGIITGSLIVGDTINRSIRAGAYDQLGPIDEVVTVSGFDDGDDLVSRFGTLDAIPGSEGVLDGVLPLVTTQVAVVGDRTQPRAQLVEVDFDAARKFGGDPRATGIVGETPAPGTVAITSDLAATTDAGVGDVITVYVYGVPVEARVDRILDRTGVAGYWPVDGRQQSYNVFATPGSLAAGLSGVTLPADVEPPQVTLAFSNVGDVESSVDLTDRATDVIGAAIDGSASIQPVKRDVITQADATGDQLSQLYFTMGMFSVAAGVLLLINIFVMLADERRSQLGMLRALGMRRRSLVLGFATEGWLYALASSAVGALIGVELGRVIAWRADAILANDNDLYALDLTFDREWGTVAQGFTIGFAIAVITIVLTSVRISRLNVIAAIRDLPVRPGRVRRRSARLVGSIALAIGVVVTASAVAVEDSYGLALGPMLLAVGIGALTVRRAGFRATVTWVTVFVLVWAAMIVPVLGWLDIATEIPIFLVQGTTMCAAAVALVMVHHKAFGAWLSERFGNSLPVRIGLAYPVAKGFRTAMMLGMFAIVILTIVYLSFISLMFSRQVDDFTADLSGGFGIVVTSNPSDPITVDELTAVDGVTAVAPLGYGFAETAFSDRQQMWPITGFGPELAAAPPALKDRGDYPTDQAAWEAVLADPSLVIADEFLLSNGGPITDTPEPGDTITITDPTTGASRQLTIAALSTDDYLIAGTFMGDIAYDDLFGDRAVASRFYVGADDVDAVALEIGRTFAANGAESNAVHTLVEGVLAQSTGFFTLMQQFVGVGLLVGIAGLGVVLVRAVRERRRDIGVLRAIGLEPRPITRTFLFEATFVAAEGVLIGILIALVGTYGLVLNGTGFMAGFSWSAPWRQIIFVAVLTLAAASFTAFIPARQAARIRPAQALRIVD
jgi:putative ABC transport system permease protein